MELQGRDGGGVGRGLQSAEELVFCADERYVTQEGDH
jgi:hypothetical protein